MGTFAEDTTVEPLGQGRYRGQLDPDWEIWGPAGGYVAAIALRAAGAESTVGPPASLSCHFLGVGRFDQVEVTVDVVRRGRSTESMQVLVHQGERPLLHAVVVTADGSGGYDHHEVARPEVPGPDELPGLAERVTAVDAPVHAFWRSVDSRAIDWIDPWPPPTPLPPETRHWMRLAAGLDGDDPWLDAARTTLLIDVLGWPAAHRHHAWRGDDLAYLAPSLDLHVAFHHPAVGEEWLLVEGEAPVSSGGLIGTGCRVLTEGGTLVGTSRSQLLWRPAPGT